MLKNFNNFVFVTPCQVCDGIGLDDAERALELQRTVREEGLDLLALYYAGARQVQIRSRGMSCGRLGSLYSPLYDGSS